MRKKPLISILSYGPTCKPKPCILFQASLQPGPAKHGKEAFRKSLGTIMNIEMSIEDKQPKPGDMVVLVGLPSRFLDSLPCESQTAITAMIGKPVEYRGITRTSGWERVELRFEEYPGRIHYINVDPSFIRLVK
jgi:hypothetical protein